MTTTANRAGSWSRPHDEQVIAHGSMDILELDRVELEIASRGEVEIASLLLEEAFIGPSSFAVLFSLVCEGIRKMTTYHTKAGGQ